MSATQRKNRTPSLGFWLISRGAWALVLLAAIVSMDFNYITRKPTDLGLAAFPPVPVAAEEPSAISTTHRLTPQQWRLTQIKAKHRLEYGLGHSAIKRLAAQHLTLERKYRRAPRGSRCLREPWSCIYADIYAQSAESLAPLTQLLRAEVANHEWHERELAAWLLAFVQQIPYRIPESLAFQVAPPAIVVSQNWGDCDSKSLLLLHLLEAVGIDAELIISRAHAHAMVVIKSGATTGRGFRHRGSTYAWAETTTKAHLGYIAPEFLQPNDWKVVNFVRKAYKAKTS